ncbi:MAG: ferritin-like domain-containing protein [Acidobacteriota bacterium]|nr:ferritin-like domain-containing protein [Blastocatellia bacterium]MDW8413727.1 ferritin-like domain-containing protein [Acidobacteriota bacterium]
MTELLEQLNKILSLEYAGVIQYMQNSFLVMGADRVVFAEFFRKQSSDALKHAALIGDKIVALGGVPTVEAGEVRQSNDLAEMLDHSLQFERSALEAYMKAWELATENKPLRFLLESIIQQEQTHLEELEKIASKKLAIATKGLSEVKHG